MLERFGGYTYETLMREDTELLRLLRIEKLGTRQETEGGGTDGWGE